MVIAQWSPWIVCFDYDFPDLKTLHALQKTKVRFPSLPIIMLTRYHSESLAIWALRSRVWDYFLKPVAVDDLVGRFETLSPIQDGRGIARQRQNIMPLPRVPLEMQFKGQTTPSTRSFAAVAFIESHYHEPIRLIDAAGVCSLRPHEFSRVFKQEQGQTFREFIARYRIKKAQEMLKHPSATITDVALATGFNDLSFFGQLFRRYMGMTPSRFRRHGARAVPGF
jgi:YesN/AraC family two-component response regulator